MRKFNAALIASSNFIQRMRKEWAKKVSALFSDDENTLMGNELKTLREIAFFV